MARRSKNKEINVFSISAIDLFASGMGVFIILYMVLIPQITKVQPTDPTGERPKASQEELEGVKQRLAQSEQKVEELEERWMAAEREKEQLTKQLEEMKTSAQAQATAQAKAKAKAKAAAPRKPPPMPPGGRPAPKPKPFVQVRANWKHPGADLDLIVIDPEGNEYSPEKTKHEDKAGAHMGNAQSGPAFEMYQNMAAQTGEYLVYVVLRQPEFAAVNFVVSANYGIGNNRNNEPIKTPVLVVDGNNPRKLVYRIVVDEGEIQVNEAD